MQKKYLIKFLMFSFLIALFGEVNYQFGPRASINETDYRLNQIRKLKAHIYSDVIISDSVLHQALRRYELKADVLDLSTTAGISFSGVYFMLRRFFENDNSTKNIHIFFVPAFIDNPKRIKSHYYSWFDRDEERKELSRFVETPYDALRTQLNKRMNSFNWLSFLLVKARLRKLPFRDDYELEKDKIFDEKIAYKDYFEESHAFADYFIDKILELGKHYGATIYFYLEPLNPYNYHQVYLKSAYKAYFEKKFRSRSVRFVDLNQSLSLPEEAFFDGRHPRPQWSKFLLFKLNRDFVKLF